MLLLRVEMGRRTAIVQGKQKDRERGDRLARLGLLNVRVFGDADITRRLDALFRDTDLAAAQLCGARELDDAGDDWADEHW